MNLIHINTRNFPTRTSTYITVNDLFISFQNDELDPASSVEVLKDNLNNKNNNSEQSSRPKCDITSRKRTSDDVLLSCIVVNNDLHGKNENNNTSPVNMSKTMASMKFSPSKSNR